MDTPNGLHEKRLNEHNPREVAFAEQWQIENDHSDYLAHLLRVNCDRKDDGARPDPAFGSWYRYPIGPPTERDRIIAATVIQWLGSNIGMDFIGQSLKRCGYQYPIKAKGHDDD